MPSFRHTQVRVLEKNHLGKSVLSGGQGRNRTTDTRIFSPLLYQLSYLAAVGERVRIRPAEFGPVKRQSRPPPP